MSETADFPTGREADLIAGGYVPLPKKEEPAAELTKDAAAEEYKNLSAPASTTIRTYTAGADVPDNVALSVEEAADALTEARADDAKVDEAKAAKDEEAFAKEVDEARGVKPEATQPAVKDEEFDLAKAIEKSPKLREEISQIDERVRTATEAQGNAIREAGILGLTGLVSDFPEIAQLPLDQWENAIRAMHQREPARAQALVGKLQNLAAIEQAHKAHVANKTAREKSEFARYAREQDRAFTEAMKGEPPARRNAIAAEMRPMLEAYGINADEFAAIAAENKFARSAGVQQLLVDATRYRLSQKTSKDLSAKLAKADLPPVARPGIAANRSGAEVRGQGNLQSLSAKLARSGDVKDAAALLLARRGARR